MNSTLLWGKAWTQIFSDGAVSILFFLGEQFWAQSILLTLWEFYEKSFQSSPFDKAYDVVQTCQIAGHSWKVNSSSASFRDLLVRMDLGMELWSPQCQVCGHATAQRERSEDTYCTAAIVPLSLFRSSERKRLLAIAATKIWPSHPSSLEQQPVQLGTKYGFTQKLNTSTIFCLKQIKWTFVLSRRWLRFYIVTLIELYSSKWHQLYSTELAGGFMDWWVHWPFRETSPSFS